MGNLGLADFYLGIAREEIGALDGLSEPVTIGSDYYSGHFHHAAIASVFGAAAVDHGIDTAVGQEDPQRE